MATVHSLFTTATAVATLILTASVATAQTPTYEQILEGARKEGRLFVAVSSPGTPQAHAAIAKAFNERFGLNITVEWNAANPVQTGTKLIAERGRASGSVDVVGAGGAQEASVLFERQILKPYPWAAVFGKQFPQIDEVADRVMKDLRGAALPILDATYGIGWNPKLIKDEDVPNTWAELLKSEWRGRFAINAFSLNPLDYYSFALGKDETLKMAKATLDNKPVLERGTAAATRAISVGQAPVGLSSLHIAGRSEGVKFKLFTDFIPVNNLYIYVPESAPNPNVARLFAAWLTTEGIAVANVHEPLPRAGDKGSPLAEMIAERVKGGAKILTENSLEDTKQALSVRGAIADLMTR
ncbi:ABC transporter substrate-binding protein [Bosea sp. (in: a-proteobacteria)]|uniref:ABC transporter substrate-binding protein n=1 Tax=Bosea sp. (in: a-proteobacteria) TaxID=1871050 RepID=UPI002FC8B859